MKLATKKIIIVLILICLAALLIWAYLEKRGELAQEQEREKPIKPATRIVSTERGNLVALDKATMAMNGIVVQPLRETVQYSEMTAYGSVVDIQDMPDWLNLRAKGDEELGKSRAQLEVSQNEYLRLKGLHDNNHNISDKALEAAEGAWRSARAQARAAEAASRNIQSVAVQRWGTVLARWLMEGNQNIDRLVRQEKALVQITVPFGALLPSPPRSIQLKGARATSTEAVFVSASPRMNPNIQGFSYYYLASTLKEGLVPGMSVVASLPVGRKVQGVFIPASAVVWWEGKAWIYLQRKEEQFERVEIPTGHPVPGGWFIPRGLSHADRVIVTGAQLLLSEELRSRIKIEE